MDTVRKIFKEKKLIYIAEIGINHNGNFSIAKEMIIQAAKAGADAVKFQIIIPEKMFSEYATSLIRDGIEKETDTSQIDFFKKLILTRDEYRALKKIADEHNIKFFSSPFDEDSVDLLEDIEVELYKIASSEITNHFLLHKIAQTKKPVIMSTGISTEEELEMAINILTRNGTPDIILLHCVSLYPLPSNSANLNRIVKLRNRFNLEVGFSDHSRDIKTAEIASALGARIFEKHFTLSKNFECPDREVSFTPEEFTEMMKSIDLIVNMLGDGHISYDFSEKDVANSARKSLFSRISIPRGKIIQLEDIEAKRPGIGIPVYCASDIIGKKSNRDIKKGFMLRKEFFI